MPLKKRQWVRYDDAQRWRSHQAGGVNADRMESALDQSIVRSMPRLRA